MGRRRAQGLAVLGLVTVLCVAVAALVASSAAGMHHRPARGAQDGPGAPTTEAALNVPRQQPPGTVQPAATASQERIDAKLAGAESPGVIARLEGLPVPAPRASAAFPPLPAADSSDAVRWCLAFVGELLDLDYAHQSRSGLLAWAESQEAPNRMPGVPLSVAGKALVASLEDGAAQGASPLPSAQRWAVLAASRTTWRVSGLSATTARSWDKLLGAGWSPADPLATIEDVTGRLTTARPGQRSTTSGFSLTVMLGSAAFHPGYGAVAVGDWHMGTGGA